MPPAIIAGGIAAVGTIGGALISSHSQSSAANQAASAEQQATNAQLQLGQQSLAQSRDIYNQNSALLNPFVQRGNVAGESINALLGLPAPTPPAPTPANTQTNQVTGAVGANGLASRPNPLARFGNGQGVQPTIPVAHPATAGTPAAAPAVSPLSATQAMNNFANSAGMQFQLQQGENAINNGYAAHGQLQSGAALKALQSYGQNTALNNYFMPYMSLLGGQQATGAGAASAVAGVGNNFANTAAGINGQMAGYIGNGADAQANAAIARGQAGASLGAGIASGLGSLASSFMPRGY